MSFSHELYQCLVCGEFKRSDNLRRHYLNNAFWDDDESPSKEKLEAFMKEAILKGKRTSSDWSKIDHTKYLIQNGFRSVPATSKHQTKSSKTMCIDKFLAPNTEPLSKKAIPSPSSSLKETISDYPTATNISKSVEPCQDMEALKDCIAMADEPVAENVTSSPTTCAEIFSQNTSCNQNEMQFQVEDVKVSSPSINDPNLISGIASSVIAEIRKDLQHEPLLDQLSNKIADIICNRIKNEEKDINVDSIEDFWIKGEKTYICDCCARFSNDPDVPVNLKSHNKNVFGFINIDQKASSLRRNLKIHETNELHKFCQKLFIKWKADQEIKETDNKIAGKLVIRNSLFCLKNSLSSFDFVKLNNKDNLVDNLATATKNDSKAEYFKIRELAHKNMTTKIQNMFQSVKSCSVTLDKVTTTHSYQVILTFFFWEGKIHIYLNKVDKLTTKDYDGPGTAKRVAQVLRETLGASNDTLAQKVKHFTYDGVYCTQEERAYGGGSLSLINYFAEEIGLQRGDVTGQHDLGHNLQLSYGDVFKKNVHIKKTLNLIYNSMKSYTCGKAAAFFQEVAKELNFIYLKNQKSQQTRFVRAILRALKAFAINLPILLSIAGQDLQDSLEENDNTEAKAAKKLCDDLTNGENLAMVIGLGQILEVYAEISLESQYSTKFPTTIWYAVDRGKDKLNSFSNSWEWENEPLKMSGIGSPKELIEGLVKGTYKPYITENQIKKHKAWNSIEKDFGENNEIEIEMDTHEDELQIEPLSEVRHKQDLGTGDIVVTNFGTVEKQKVEDKLKKICNDLVKAMDKRINKSNLQKQSIFLFGKNPISMDSVSVTDIKNLIKLIPGPHAESYSPQVCYPGYITWRQYIEAERELNEKLSDEQVWVSFVKKHGKSFKSFIDLYEDLQIRAMSEAMAETVGSMMGAAIARGRNPHPLNLSKELCLRFNLPPLHCLDDFIEEIYKQRKIEKAEYIRRISSKRPDMLISAINSAAIHNFRKKQETDSHLPLDIWKS